MTKEDIISILCEEGLTRKLAEAVWEKRSADITEENFDVERGRRAARKTIEGVKRLGLYEKFQKAGLLL